MNPHAPFRGVLHMPDRAVLRSTSPVTLADGRPLASIRWHTWNVRARFDILDPAGVTELAHGSRVGVIGRRYAARVPGGAALLELRLARWLGVGGRCTVALPDGETLTVRGNWTRRAFAIEDRSGRPVGRILRTGAILALRPDSLTVELDRAALTAVQAIALAQCLRAAIGSARSSDSSAAAVAAGG
ncbi:hypothetical protein Val02_09320 [Virgisporangium aliadipatigenens]|uniref:Uncharacterized protein n=1 Tax=Virgisporangium aliadipatigenens TaxID=741659 RepID=A0A8J3YHI3_9ACTN|nr:hypothetical protein [Virgisporangium aliadipatigenens]GIJ44046.1 hypothetical protein Val02_09320 [Virgisporangium aliadipatigenens]